MLSTAQLKEKTASRPTNCLLVFFSSIAQGSAWRQLAVLAKLTQIQLDYRLPQRGTRLNIGAYRTNV